MYHIWASNKIWIWVTILFPKVPKENIWCRFNDFIGQFFDITNWRLLLLHVV